MIQWMFKLKIEIFERPLNVHFRTYDIHLDLVWTFSVRQRNIRLLTGFLVYPQRHTQRKCKQKDFFIIEDFFSVVYDQGAHDKAC